MEIRLENHKKKKQKQISGRKKWVVKMEGKNKFVDEVKRKRVGPVSKKG